MLSFHHNLQDYKIFLFAEFEITSTYVQQAHLSDTTTENGISNFSLVEVKIEIGCSPFVDVQTRQQSHDR